MLTAAFFVPELAVQEREQCEDCADDVENEVEPIKLVHDITPSLSRGKPTISDLPRQIYHTFRKFSSVLR